MSLYFDDLPDEMIQEIINYLDDDVDYLKFCEIILRTQEKLFKFKRIITSYYRIKSTDISFNTLRMVNQYPYNQYKEIYTLLPNGNKHGNYEKYIDLYIICLFPKQDYQPVIHNRKWELKEKRLYEFDNIIESTKYSKEFIEVSFTQIKVDIITFHKQGEDVTIKTIKDYHKHTSIPNFITKYDYKLEEIFKMKDGYKYEIRQRWWSEDKLRTIACYKDSEKIGVWESYDIDGNLLLFRTDHGN